VTYARVAKRKPAAKISKKAINKIVRNINKERPDEPAEFSVLHIEFKNSKQISQLVKAKQYEALGQIMKKNTSCLRNQKRGHQTLKNRKQHP
jgi:mevalonate kinase